MANAGPDEIALDFDEDSPDVHLSRVDALRLAARLRQVAEANRSAWAASSRPFSGTCWGPAENRRLLPKRTGRERSGRADALMAEL